MRACVIGELRSDADTWGGLIRGWVCVRTVTDMVVQLKRHPLGG